MKTALLAASAAAITMCLAFAQPAFATGEIVAPTSGVINSGGPGFGSLTDTFNQNGLSSGYTSGVTNFNSYIGTNPTHTLVFSGYEWFSNQGTNSASVTYNLGSLMGIDALALWNEESSGIGTLALFGSVDGIVFNSLGVFNPFDNPLADYPAEVFGFGPALVQYVRFDMSNCPQQDPGNFQACAIGEVAFRTAQVTGVPEPGTWAMMLLGFGATGFALRRSRKRAQAATQLA
jgi:PEP-CTERM motif-containing protein